MTTLIPNVFDKARACRKFLDKQRRYKENAGITALMMADIDGFDFSTLVGASLAIAKICADPKLRDEIRAAGEAAVAEIVPVAAQTPP